MFRILKVSGVGVMSLLVVSFWLWGASALRHLKVMSDGVRTTIVEGVESGENQLKVVAEEIEAAKRETQEIAQSVGEVRSATQGVQQGIERLLGEQRQDEQLLLDLKQQLCNAGDRRVRIGDKDFSRSDLEHDAAVILDRHHSRADQIKDEKMKLAELEQRQESLRKTLREHIARIRKLEVSQEEGHRLVDDQRFNEWLAIVDGRPVKGRAIAQAEESQATVLRNLRRQAAGSKVMQEVTSGGPTPAADGSLMRRRAWTFAISTLS